MTSVAIDFRFSDIRYELWALGQYLDLMERELPALSDADRIGAREMFSHPASREDPSEADFAYQAADEMEERVIPRLFLAPFIISLWSVFESATIEVSEYIAKQKGTNARISDLRGDFLSRAKKYFEDILGYELCLAKDCWEELRALNDIRNAFAHGNGRLSALPSRQFQRIEKITAQYKGLEIDEGFLLPSMSYVRARYESVFNLLDDLIGRVKVGFSDLLEQ